MPGSHTCCKLICNSHIDLLCMVSLCDIFSVWMVSSFLFSSFYLPDLLVLCGKPTWDICIFLGPFPDGLILLLESIDLPLNLNICTLEVNNCWYLHLNPTSTITSVQNYKQLLVFKSKSNWHNNISAHHIMANNIMAYQCIITSLHIKIHGYNI